MHGGQKVGLAKILGFEDDGTQIWVRLAWYEPRRSEEKSLQACIITPLKMLQWSSSRHAFCEKH